MKKKEAERIKQQQQTHHWNDIKHAYISFSFCIELMLFYSSGSVRAYTFLCTSRHTLFVWIVMNPRSLTHLQPDKHLAIIMAVRLWALLHLAQNLHPANVTNCLFKIKLGLESHHLQWVWRFSFVYIRNAFLFAFAIIGMINFVQSIQMAKKARTKSCRWNNA